MPKIKVYPCDPTMFMYWDVATGTANAFWVREQQPRWTWNGDYDRPTVSPSILNSAPRYMNPETGEITAPWRNHVFIRDGKIQYLSDCTHALAGQTVDMVEFPEDWDCR